MTDRRATLLVLAAAVAYGVAVVVYALSHWDGLYDDAFIYLRYARNLDEGCGLRFNCDGPLVEGFTGPLYLALLWVGGWFTDQRIWWCQVVGTASIVLAGVAGLAAVRGYTRSMTKAVVPAIALVLVLGLDAFIKLNCNNGMETALGGATVTLVFAAVLFERPRLLVAAIIACVLVRPEAALFVLALPLLPWMRRWQLLAAAFGLLAAIALARYAVFGELVPNTYIAKSGGTWRHAALGLAYIGDAIRDFPLVLLAPLALFGTRRREARYLLVVAFVWLAFFLRSGGDLFSYSRLWFPLVPGLSALALCGSLEFAERHTRHAVAVPLVLALVFGARAAVVHDIPPQGANDRLAQWVATGLYVRKHFKNALTATVPIGAIGYYSRNPILDLVGLTEPAIARAKRTVPEDMLTKKWIGHERNYTEYVLERAPAVIVTTSTRDRPWTLAEARAGFWADWLLLQEIKAGRAPYRLHDAEVRPGEHVLMFVRAP